MEGVTAESRNHFMSRLPKPQSGFTLIELMIVVVVIAILAAIAIPNFAQMMDRAKEGSTKANMHTMQLATEDYGVQNEGKFPDVIDSNHIVNLMTGVYKNPYSGTQGQGAAWEDRGTFAAPATGVSGISSYSDSATTQYNIKGHGKEAALTLILAGGS